MQHPPGTPNSNSRRFPNVSPTHDAGNNQAALKGALLAVQRTGPSPGPRPSNTDVRTNGALIAATSASRDHSLSRSPSRASNAARLSRQATGNSLRDDFRGQEIDHGVVAQRLAQLHSSPQTQQRQPSNHQPQNASSFLNTPNRQPMADFRSPSFIAATLAASRSASPGTSHVNSPANTPHSKAATRHQRQNSVGAQSVASSTVDLDLTDATSIAPTNALVSMFEKKGDQQSDNTDPVKKLAKPRAVPQPRAITPTGSPDISFPKLATVSGREREPLPPVSVSKRTKSATEQDYTLPSGLGKHRPPSPPARNLRIDPTRHLGESYGKSKTRDLTPPPPPSRTTAVILSPQPRRAASHKMVRPESSSPGRSSGITRKKLPPPVVKSRPRPITIHTSPTKAPVSRARASSVTKGSTASVFPIEPASASSNDTFVSASSAISIKPSSTTRGYPQSPTARLPPPYEARPSSTKSMPTGSPPQRRNPVPPPPRRSQPASANLPLTSLTSATMAGILASSRASPSRGITSSTPPAPPPTRTPHLRQTLRQPGASKSDDEEARARERYKKKPLQSKKKHAHHEGARRRWRNEITERERKRYEGVWASNRGLLVPTPTGLMPSSAHTPPETDLVVNVVVRDIWSRSRLPFDELTEVWDLVDSKGAGVLDKVEFVVGLWLIDQRLRGRKIPQKVSDSVWGSAKGLRVLAPPKGKKGKHH